MPDAITQIDFQILNWMQTNLQCAFADWFFPWFTALGNGGFLWLLLAALLLCRRDTRRQGVQILIGLAVGFLLVNLLLKPLVARPRPCWLADFPLRIARPSDFSFPSGHTVSSFIAAFILAAKWKKAGAAALITASLIAFSRLYLYVHFPSDVLTSVVIAAFVSAGVVWLTSKKRICIHKGREGEKQCIYRNENPHD